MGRRQGVCTGQRCFLLKEGVSLTGGFRQRLCGPGGAVTCWRQRWWGCKCTNKHDRLRTKPPGCGFLTAEPQGEGTGRLGGPFGQDPCAPGSRSENLTGFGLRANLTSFLGPSVLRPRSPGQGAALSVWPSPADPGRIDPVDSGRSCHHVRISNSSSSGACFISQAPSRPRGQELGFLVCFHLSGQMGIQVLWLQLLEPPVS